MPSREGDSTTPPPPRHAASSSSPTATTGTFPGGPIYPPPEADPDADLAAVIRASAAATAATAASSMLATAGHGGSSGAAAAAGGAAAPVGSGGGLLQPATLRHATLRQGYSQALEHGQAQGQGLGPGPGSGLGPGPGEGQTHDAVMEVAAEDDGLSWLEAASSYSHSYSTASINTAAAGRLRAALLDRAVGCYVAQGRLNITQVWWAWRGRVFMWWAWLCGMRGVRGCLVHLGWM